MTGSDDDRRSTRARSAKAKQEALRKRKQDTGTRRGDPKAGSGKDRPPKGGRNRSGRGQGK